MAITVVGSSSANNTAGNSVTSLAPAKPTGTLQNDVMIAFGYSSSGNAMSAPVGWTVIGTPQDDSGVSLWFGAWYKVAGASEPSSYTFTVGTAAGIGVGMYAFRGAATSSPIDVSGASITNTTNPSTMPSITTTAPDVLVFARNDRGSTTSYISSSCAAATSTTNFGDHTATIIRTASLFYIIGDATVGANGGQSMVTSGGTLANGANIIVGLKDGITIVQGADTGAFVDASTQAHGNGDDAVAATGTAAVSAIIVDTDSGAGVDSAASVVPIAAADASGAAVDTAHVSAIIPDTDAGSGIEQFTVLNVGSGGILAFGQDVASATSETAVGTLTGHYFDAGNFGDNATVAIQGPIPDGYERIIRVQPEVVMVSGI